MSRLQVPLLGRTLQATGQLLLRAELDLLLKNQRGLWHPQTFLVDSGSEMTLMPAALAKQLDLPMPHAPVVGATHEQTGLPFRDGYLRAQVLGMDGTEYAFPCYFVGDPDAPDPAGKPTLARNLLGLTGVVDKLRFTLDGGKAPGAPDGTLTVEKR